MPNENTIHCVRLMLIALDVSITLMVEVAQGKVWHPCAFVMFNAVDEEEW
jgi:hypothetical protein